MRPSHSRGPPPEVFPSVEGTDSVARPLSCCGTHPSMDRHLRDRRESTGCSAAHAPTPACRGRGGWRARRRVPMASTSRTPPIRWASGRGQRHRSGGDRRAGEAHPVYCLLPAGLGLACAVRQISSSWRARAAEVVSLGRTARSGAESMEQLLPWLPLEPAQVSPQLSALADSPAHPKFIMSDRPSRGPPRLVAVCHTPARPPGGRTHAGPRLGMIGLPLSSWPRDLRRIVKLRGARTSPCTARRDRPPAHYFAARRAMPLSREVVLAVDEIQLCADPSRHVFTTACCMRRGRRDHAAGRGTMAPWCAA